MAFYDMPKEERAALVLEIKEQLLQGLMEASPGKALRYFSDEDTYIRKAAYLNTGRIYFEYPSLQHQVIALLESLAKHTDFKARQTVINAAGEIGKTDFDIVRPFFDAGLFDRHHSPRNAVIGSIKKMGEVNPTPVLEWAQSYLHHPDKEIRREICHGIELRGRKHPEDILPLLQQLEQDKTSRVRNTLYMLSGRSLIRRVAWK